MQELENKDDAPFMSGTELGQSLRGMGINLLVKNMTDSLHFATTVLGATVVHTDNNDFAFIKLGDDRWMLHSDRSYKGNALYGLLKNDDGTPLEGRGVGIEIRLYDVDPDMAVLNARRGGYIILADCIDKVDSHGLREAVILDSDGYCWIPSRPLNNNECGSGG